MQYNPNESAFPYIFAGRPQVSRRSPAGLLILNCIILSSMSKTTFGYPVEKLCGKISRHSRVIHACTPSGGQITYLQGTRDLVAHPITSGETTNRQTFATKHKKVMERLDPGSSSYAADVAAFRAQYATGYKTLRAYLWHTV